MFSSCILYLNKQDWSSSYQFSTRFGHFRPDRIFSVPGCKLLQWLQLCNFQLNHLLVFWFGRNPIFSYAKTSREKIQCIVISVNIVKKGPFNRHDVAIRRIENSLGNVHSHLRKMCRPLKMQTIHTNGCCSECSDRKAVIICSRWFICHVDTSSAILLLVRKKSKSWKPTFTAWLIWTKCVWIKQNTLSSW